MNPILIAILALVAGYFLGLFHMAWCAARRLNALRREHVDATQQQLDTLMADVMEMQKGSRARLELGPSHNRRASRHHERKPH